MRMTKVLFAGAAIMAATFALEITDHPEEVQPGQGYRITYEPDEGDTKFLLKRGETDNLKDVATLTESASGGQFFWRPDDGLENHDDYALEIQQGDKDPNYVGPIKLTGGKEPAEEDEEEEDKDDAE